MFAARCAHVHPEGGWCCLATALVPWFVACSAHCPGLRHPAAIVAWHLLVCLGCGRRRDSLACLVACLPWFRPRVLWASAPRGPFPPVFFSVATFVFLFFSSRPPFPLSPDPGPPFFCFFFFPLCAPLLSLAFSGSGPGCRGPWRCVVLPPLFFSSPGLPVFLFVSSRPPFPLSPALPLFFGVLLLPPPGVCLAGLPLFGSGCPPAVFFFAWPLAAPAAPTPGVCFAVVVAAARCSVFFLRYCAVVCLLGVRRQCPPFAPLPLCCACAALCCRASPRRVALLSVVLRWSGVLQCCVAVFFAAGRAVVPRLALLWAARCFAVFVGAAFSVLCCAFGCCCVLRRVSGHAVRLRWSRCGLLSGFGLRCCVLCCGVSLGAVLRVFSPSVVLLCAVLFGFVRLVPLLVVPCPLALPVALGSCAFLCFVVFSCAVCFVLCVFCRGVLVRAVGRRCALYCVLSGVSCCGFPVLSAPCGAALRCAGSFALCCWCGLRWCWRLVLWCAALCCAVFLGVLWCGAGSGCLRFSSGGVFWCLCPCLAAWPGSLWLARFAVVPCSSVLCSGVLCCRVVLCCRALLSVCGAVCAWSVRSPLKTAAITVKCFFPK